MLREVNNHLMNKACSMKMVVRFILSKSMSLSNVQKITSAEIGSNFSLESFMRQPHPVRGDIR